MISDSGLREPSTTHGTILAEGLLKEQVAIVSGGGSGIGRATVLELAAAGATVVCCGRTLAPLRETVALAPSGSVEAVQCDIREPEQVETLVDSTLEHRGRIDLLVNNAGGQFFAAAENISPKGFNAVCRLNLEGTWLMTHTVATRAFIPSGRGGKVISITMTPRSGAAGMAHSAAARAGIETLMRVLAIEWARFGIKLNSVAAGIVETNSYRTKYPDEVRTYTRGLVPLARLGTPEDMARMIAFLASPGGDYVTGAVIAVDGGLDVHQGQYPPAELLTAQGQMPVEARRAKVQNRDDGPPST